MKKVLATFCLLLLVLSIYAFKSNFEIKVLNSFRAPIEKLDGSHSNFAFSDSLIYVIDFGDSTNTKSYCFDYKGRPVAFHIPSDSLYRISPWTKYLYSKHCLTIDDLHKVGIDFYSLDGKFLERKIVPFDWSFYVNLCEYKDNLYYTVMKLDEVYKGKRASSWTIYKMVDDSLILQVKALRPKNAPQPLFGDSNRNDIYSIAQIKNGAYHISYFDDASVKEFDIKRPKNEELVAYYTGKGYVVLIHEKNQGDVYDTNGKFLGSLSKIKGVKGGLQEIVGDKQIYFDFKSKTFTICE